MWLQKELNVSDLPFRLTVTGIAEDLHPIPNNYQGSLCVGVYKIQLLINIRTDIKQKNRILINTVTRELDSTHY